MYILHLNKVFCDNKVAYDYSIVIPLAWFFTLPMSKKVVITNVESLLVLISVLGMQIKLEVCDRQDLSRRGERRCCDKQVFLTSL
jgi:hypothetical protein